MSRPMKQADPLEPERHQCARVEVSSNHSRDRGSTMNVTTYGLDLAKRVFQVHWVEPETGELKRKALARAEVSASQAVLSLHRMRAQLVKIRTMQGYQVRSLTYEFGVVAPKSWRALLAQVAPLLADPTRCPVPELVRVELLNQLEGLRTLTARIDALERQIGGWQRREEE